MDLRVLERAVESAERLVRAPDASDVRDVRVERAVRVVSDEVDVRVLRVEPVVRAVRVDRVELVDRVARKPSDVRALRVPLDERVRVVRDELEVPAASSSNGMLIRRDDEPPCVREARSRAARCCSYVVFFSSYSVKVDSLSYRISVCRAYARGGSVPRAYLLYMGWAGSLVRMWSSAQKG